MYDHQFSELAQSQLLHLPYDALAPMAEALVQACIDPWNFQRRSEEFDDRHYAHRYVEFGEGRGRLWFLIRDGEGLLWVTEIQWRD